MHRQGFGTRRHSGIPELFARTDVRLGLLMLVCVIPRAILAWRLPAVCDDAYYYGHVADALDRGHFERALEYLNINVYPVVLVLLHRLGLDWIVAGKLWGVCLGTALVIPLYDWLRRLFDERIATVGVFLYAVHPKIIEATVEPIREATFWFLFVVCLDLFWRASRERRWWQFAAGGASFALALHTRFEAWFLIVPLAAWALFAWRHAPSDWGRLLWGNLLCLAITPLFVLGVNCTLLGGHSRWELGRLSPFVVVAEWIHPKADAATTSVPTSVPAPKPAPPPPRPTPPPTPPPRAAIPADSKPAVPEPVPPSFSRTYFAEMGRALGVVFLVLTAVGLVRGRRRLFDRQTMPLTVLTLAIPLAIWVRLSQFGNSNDRYFLLLVFVDAPFAAIGGLTVLGWFERTADAWKARWLPPRLRPVLIAACVLAAGWIQGMGNHHTHRESHVRLGRWILSQVRGSQAGRFRSVVADYQSIRPAYSAGHGMPEVILFDEFFEKRFDQAPPDLAIFQPAWYRPDLIPHLMRRASDLGLVPLDQTSFSRATPEFVIFVRKNERPAGDSVASVLSRQTTAVR